MSKSLVAVFPAEVRVRLGALLARSSEFAVERRAQEERREIAETRAAELLRQRDELGRQRVAVYDPGDRSRVDRLIAGDAEAIDAKEAERRARHNEQLGLLMATIEGDAELLTTEARLCAERIAGLADEIAATERSFLLTLQTAVFEGFKEAAVKLVFDYLAPLRAIDQLGGAPAALSPQSAQGITRLGWKEKRHTTVNRVQLEQEVAVTLWPHGGGKLPNGEPFDPAQIINAIRAEIAGDQPKHSPAATGKEAA